MNRDEYKQLLEVTGTHLTGTMPTNRYMAPCNCVGPQGGRPLCPCMMRSVQIRDGRYIVPERDLGPVVEADRAASPTDEGREP